MAWHPFRHVGLKVLALVLGVLLWLVTGRTVERNVRVPLAFRNVPATLEITGNPPDTVDVRVRGAAGQLGRLEQGDIMAYVDLTDAKPGPRVVNLRPEDVSAPLGVEVSLVLTPRVSFDLERSATATVPVVPVVEGEPAAGYARGPTVMAPPQVTIVGPESHVKQVRSVSTEPVSIADATTTQVETVGLSISDATVRLVAPQTVRVTVQIVPAIERELGERAVVVRGLPPQEHATVSPALVAVTLRGSKTTLDTLNEAQIQPYVDVTGLRPGDYHLPVHVTPQLPLASIMATPTIVTVRIH